MGKWQRKCLALDGSGGLSTLWMYQIPLCPYHLKMCNVLQILPFKNKASRKKMLNMKTYNVAQKNVISSA